MADDLLGAIGGALEDLGEEVVETTVDVGTNLAEGDLGGAADAAVEGAQDIGEIAQDGATEALDELGDSASEAGETGQELLVGGIAAATQLGSAGLSAVAEGRETVEDTVDRGTQAVQQTLGQVKDLVADGRETVEDTVDRGSQAVQQTLGQVKDLVADGREAIDETLAGDGDNVGRTPEEAIQELEAAVDAGLDAGGDVAGRFVEGATAAAAAAGSVVEATGEAVSAGADAGGELADDIGDAVGDAADSINVDVDIHGDAEVGVEVGGERVGVGASVDIDEDGIALSGNVDGVVGGSQYGAGADEDGVHTDYSYDGLLGDGSSHVDVGPDGVGVEGDQTFLVGDRRFTSTVRTEVDTSDPGSPEVTHERSAEYGRGDTAIQGIEVGVRGAGGIGPDGIDHESEGSVRTDTSGGSDDIGSESSGRAGLEADGIRSASSGKIEYSRDDETVLRSEVESTTGVQAGSGGIFADDSYGRGARAGDQSIDAEVGGSASAESDDEAHVSPSSEADESLVDTRVRSEAETDASSIGGPVGGFAEYSEGGKAIWRGEAGQAVAFDATEEGTEAPTDLHMSPGTDADDQTSPEVGEDAEIAGPESRVGMDAGGYVEESAESGDDEERTEAGRTWNGDAEAGQIGVDQGVQSEHIEDGVETLRDEAGGTLNVEVTSGDSTQIGVETGVSHESDDAHSDQRGEADVGLRGETSEDGIDEARVEVGIGTSVDADGGQVGLDLGGHDEESDGGDEVRRAGIGPTTNVDIGEDQVSIDRDPYAGYAEEDGDDDRTESGATAGIAVDNDSVGVETSLYFEDHESDEQDHRIELGIDHGVETTDNGRSADPAVRAEGTDEGDVTRHYPPDPLADVLPESAEVDVDELDLDDPGEDDGIGDRLGWAVEAVESFIEDVVDAVEDLFDDE